MPIEIKKWDAEKDLLITDQEPLLPAKHPYIYNDNRSYYFNTAYGCYRIGSFQNIEQFSSRHDLFYFDGKNERTVLQDISFQRFFRYHRLWFIFDRNTGRYFVIDSRGILFEFTSLIKERDIKIPLAKIELSQGYYLVCGQLKMYFRDKAQQQEYADHIKADIDATIDNEFERFIRDNLNNEKKYLYLTGGKSKCGTFLDHFISNGMEYERIPNLFIDDETINLRIPLYGDNAKRKDIQFLAAKYSNTYAIQSVPIALVCSGMKLGYDIPKKYDTPFFVPPEKQILVYSIVNTLRSLYQPEDDVIVFQNTLEKILILLHKTATEIIPNEFCDFMLLYPEDSKLNVEYLRNQLPNFCSLLSINDESVLWDESSSFFGFNRKMYIEACDAAFRRRRELIRDYETQVMQEITAKGKKVSKWVNEGELYSMVVKHYSDSVFQFRAEWLGMQSIDVFIPSLMVGIEYQGLQHYEPVEFFGGEKAFQRTQERDKRKAELCKENGVTLIYWRYDEPISASRLKTKLKDAGITTV